MSVNSRATVGAAILYCVVGASAFLILPLLISAAAEDFSLNETQLGYLAAAAMSGSAVSAALTIFWVRRINWKKTMLTAMWILGAGHLCAIFADTYSLLILAIIIASLGSVLVTAENFIAINTLVAVSVLISFILFIPACRGEKI